MFFNSERIAENDAPVWDTWFNFSDLGRVRGDAKVRAAPSRPSHKGAFSRGSCRRIERRDDSAPRRALRRIRCAPPRGRGRGAVMGGAAATTTTSNRTTAPTTNSGDDRRRTDDFRPNDDDQKTTDSFPNGFAAAAALSDEGPERLRVKPRDRRAPHDARARALGHTLGVFDSYSSFFKRRIFLPIDDVVPRPSGTGSRTSPPASTTRRRSAAARAATRLSRSFEFRILDSSEL